ncbi:DUF84 family protein [Bacillus sp. AGMB 02131]|uniref:Probable inosine/xanthosine triphosphatase n=1 Tax=Peribacillus faecalis TaxID=2772559 RepID=A0A927D2R6_9BACI|nr:DUF84 family protein [Peribacillus faecalis]MBD3110505.1 DUF84 family protein [Peribacillus faecalis]
MKIAIGSKNPAKVEAVRDCFINEANSVIPVDVPSGVSDQPFSDEETIEGAINRAKASRLAAGAQIGIGLEGGVVQTPYGLFLCNWGALAVEGEEPIIAGGARIKVPADVAERLMNGEELGPVMDDYTKQNNVRHKEGAIGVFTREAVSRRQMFVHIMQMLIGQYRYRESGKI